MIFNLFKSKPTLKELIPEGFVDIHSHILPGIDDGAKNIEESLALISEMKKMGFSKIIGTPHIYKNLYENDEKTINKSFQKIKRKSQTDIKIDFAAEYMLDSYFLENLLHSNKLITLKEKYVLVEMSYIFAPNKLYEIIFEIRTNGYIPILAHPERYTFLHNNFKEYIKLKKIGCEFQANMLSLTGYYGKDVLKVCSKLLKNNLVDYFGSDIHNQRHIDNFDKKVHLKDYEKIKIKLDNSKIFI